MKNNLRYVLALALALISCAIQPLPTPELAATPKTKAYHMPVEIPIVGCWWIRETPGGQPLDSVCDTSVPVGDVIRTGWAKTPEGWICIWAFGVSRADGECELRDAQ